MIISVLFLMMTVFMLYIGYTYKGVFIFIVGMLFEDTCKFIYKYKSPRCKYNKDRETYTLRFFLEDVEYKMVLPKRVMKNRMDNSRLLAMSGSNNRTAYIRKVLGPGGNFFGANPTPAELGIVNSKYFFVWLEKQRYIFRHHDPIVFDDDSLNRMISSDDDDDDDDEEDYDTNTSNTDSESDTGVNNTSKSV